jgi:ribosome-binding protein aMBF1 (putative translation factor)
MSGTHQDWETVVVHGAKKSAADVRKAGGTTVAVAHKDPESARLAKLDNSEEVAKPKTLDMECRVAMAPARAEKKLTQVQLNTQLSFPANTIREIEAGRLLPTPLQLTRISRALGIPMRYTK